MSVSEETKNIVTDSVTEVVVNQQIDLSITSLIMSSDFIVKAVIFILIAASIKCWAIIINKLLQFSTLKKDIKKFENLFWSGQVLDDIYQKIKTSASNPLSATFVATIDECKKSPSANKSEVYKAGKKNIVIERMKLTINQELEHLETRLNFLATVGASATFIGLFGTVWGIMHSFQGIATSKNTSLAVVAPGIAEALLATAIGLFVAIPATWFYNYLTSEVDKLHSKSEHFSGELNIIISRAIDEDRM